MQNAKHSLHSPVLKGNPSFGAPDTLELFPSRILTLAGVLKQVRPDQSGPH